MIRRPAVAGTFYPAQPDVLRRELERMTRGRRPPSDPKALALLVPHAGYVYSGPIAAAAYLGTALADRLILMGPNHTGEGEAIAVMDRGVWRTPLGDAAIDEPLAAAVLARCHRARADAAAHRGEHSLEVQLPFLQHLLGSFRFVPICVGTSRLEDLLDLGRGVAETVAAEGGGISLVLSSDMSHYIPAVEAERLDEIALERLAALDPEGLHRVVERHRISMCGVAPTVAGIEAARRLGASAVRRIAYGHSGERTGDESSVVAYAAAAIH